MNGNSIKQNKMKERGMICIYHSRDLDGWMSAAIVKLVYPEIKLIGWDYGEPIPDLSFKEVIMVDVSFPKETMADNANRLTWIDHHISAIKDILTLEPSPFIGGKRDNKFAACELTWQYFFPNKPMPEIVRLLGRYDCFGHKGTAEEQIVLEFQYVARAYLKNPDDCLVMLLYEIGRVAVPSEMSIQNMLQAGKGIYKYLCTEAEQKYSKRFTIELDGWKFGCVNDWRLNPINFGINYHQDGYDGFACFWYENGQFSYSLYNDNGLVDCSVIAKKRGGGGHKGASGFRSEIVIK